MGRMLKVTSCCALVLAVACGEQLDDETAGMDTVPAAGQEGGELPLGGTVGDAPVAAEVDVVLREWEIELSVDSVPAGAITFNIRNEGNEPHAFRIFRGAEEWEVEPYPVGDGSSMSVVLTPGTYEVHCPIGSPETGHAQRGMLTRLRVY